MSSAQSSDAKLAASSSPLTPPATYQAPYEHLDFPCQNYYWVIFKPGHTLTGHFAAVGNHFDTQSPYDYGYYAKLSPELFEAVRRDPGVETIVDDPLLGEGGSFGPTEEELEEARLADEEKERAAKGESVPAAESSRDAPAAYQALYHQQESPLEDHYMIAFRSGHTLAAHFASVGKDFRIQGELDEGYYAKLDRELFEAVRRDPGVELVEDDSLGEFGPTEEELERSRLEDEEGRAKWSPEETSSQTAIPSAQVVPTDYQAPYNRLSGYPYKDCYTVELKSGHTMAKHFAFVGKEYEYQEATSTWYYAKLDPELFEAVRRDPGVEMVEDDPLEGEQGESFGPTEEELEEARLADEQKERPAQEE
nr:hypothetical protein B0A51_17939 [Rachicladosporium sp. CCFEE 5018]